MPLEILLDPFAVLKGTFRGIADDCIKPAGSKNFREIPVCQLNGWSVWRSRAGQNIHDSSLDDLRADEGIAAPDGLSEVPEYFFRKCRRSPRAGFSASMVSASRKKRSIRVTATACRLISSP